MKSVFDSFMKDVESKREKEIYVYIYALLLLAIVTVIIGGASGYISSKNLISVLNSRNNAQTVADISSKAGDLRDMQIRLSNIKGQFEEIKYPNRNTLRGNINQDMAKIEFNVQTFTLKDYDPTLALTAKAIAQNGGKAPAAGTETTASNMPKMVEINITGRIPERNLVKLSRMMDRKDRIWYIAAMEITPPEGAGDFFSKTYLDLPIDKKKDMFDMYQDSFDDPTVTCSVIFYTFVKDGSDEPLPTADNNNSLGTTNASDNTTGTESTGNSAAAPQTDAGTAPQQQ